MGPEPEECRTGGSVVRKCRFLHCWPSGTRKGMFQFVWETQHRGSRRARSCAFTCTERTANERHQRKAKKRVVPADAKVTLANASGSRAGSLNGSAFLSPSFPSFTSFASTERTKTISKHHNKRTHNNGTIGSTTNQPPKENRDKRNGNYCFSIYKTSSIAIPK